MELAIVIHSLDGGGAERAAVDLANHLASRGDRVTMITLAPSDNDMYELSSNVRRIGLNATNESSSLIAALRNNWRRVRTLRSAILAAGCTDVVSFTERINVLSLLACRGTSIRVVICERTVPAKYAIGRVWSMLRTWTYPRCASLVVQTDDVAQWFGGTLRRSPIYVLPNAVSSAVSFDPGLLREKDERKQVIAMGRLSAEKQFSHLIDAFGRVAKEFPEWTLSIYGEGPDHQQLEQQANRLGLADRVHLPGWTHDTQSTLLSADVFALTSRFEGFPNALLEAMACGLACISYDCDCGPREIIRSGHDGLLIQSGNVNALEDALRKVLGDQELRRQLGKAAQDVRDRFSRDVYCRRWDAILRKVDLAEYSNIR